MDELIFSSMVIVAEVAVVMLVVFSAIGYVLLKRRRMRRVAAKDFVASFKQAIPAHASELQELFTECRQLDEEMANRCAEQLLKHERSLYKRVLNLFLGYERGSLAGLNDDVGRLVRCCFYLTMDGDEQKIPTQPAVQHVAAPEDSDAPDADVAELRAQIKALAEERDRLQTELDDAMSTMDRVLTEYANMYEGQANAKMKKLEKEADNLKRRVAS